jgi:choline dehydrogenase-like flavoprotein
MNAMMYVCGTDANYNYWADAAGDSSWNYANMLPLIKKNHNMKDSSLTSGSNASYYGTSGPLTVSSCIEDLTHDALNPVLKDAATELSFNQLQDINCGAPYTGFVHVRSTVQNNQRESSARAFLVPLENKKNFYFMRESFVDKLMLSTDATGGVLVDSVKVLTKQSGCKTINIKAKREVILSAGTYNTPKILLKSGIGKAADLASCSITQKKDLPVGRNLADHVASLHFYTMPGGITANPATAFAYWTALGLQYSTLNTGHFSSGGFNYHAFVNTTSSTSAYPDVQVIFGQFEQNLVDFENLFLDRFGYKKEFTDQLFTANKQNTVVMALSLVLQPKSRGTVKLGANCADPYANPIIDGNYLSEPDDLETLLRGGNFVRNVFNTPAAQKAGIKPLNLVIPECDSFTRYSDAYNRCYVKYFTQTLWHPAGTNKMGTSATDSVVDSTLKVFGVKRTATNPMLRVIDSSIMPNIMSGNIQCPTYAIGEKGAAMIIAENA